MRQLSAQDAMFLHIETGRTPMHIGALSIYDPSTAPGGRVSIEQIQTRIEERLGLADAFTQTLVWVPFGLDHPSWVIRGDVDVEFHVRHLALPRPGDWSQLWKQAARLHARPLDLNRPLWEVTVIEGLDHLDGVPTGAYGVLSKVHHAAIDGVSGQEITAAIHDLDAAGELAPTAKPVRPDRRPTEGELFARGMVSAVTRPLRVAQLGRGVLPGARSLFGRAASRDIDLADAIAEVPRTRFNGSVSPHRTLTGVKLPLDAVKSIKGAVDGATVNDVVLAVCSGGLRRYLDHHGELPDRSLAAMVPVSVRDADAQSELGNAVSAMAVGLHTDVVPDLARLAAIYRSSRAAKSIEGDVGRHLLSESAELIPAVSAGLASRLAMRLVIDRKRPLANCVITNVPGPQFPLFSAGAQLIEMYGTGPIVDGLGLFVAVLSYDGEVTITATSCREMIPDPDRFRGCLLDSFESLLADTK